MADNRWLAVPIYPVELRDQWLGQIAASLAEAMPGEPGDRIAERACDITLALLCAWREIPAPPKGVPDDTAVSLALKHLVAVLQANAAPDTPKGNP